MSIKDVEKVCPMCRAELKVDVYQGCEEGVSYVQSRTQGIYT